MPELETSVLMLGWAALGGYLLGSIPFGLLIARALSLGDLRQIGSGNIGATNVLRTGNKTAAVLTLLLDGGKAALAVWIFRLGGGEAAAQVAAIGAFLGHCLPIWLGFRGGKGVAAFVGIVLALHWPSGLAVCGAWAAGAALTRISSMGALTAAGLGPFIMMLFDRWEAVLVAILLAALVFWRHRANIVRLRSGTEPRIGERSGRAS